MLYRLSGGRPKIQWDDVRARAEFAGDALEIPRSEVETFIGQSDRELDEDPALTDFCKRHGISIDWLVTGDVVQLLRHARKVLT